MEKKQTTAAYKAVAGPDGNRYQFYCDLSGALLCTTGPYRADTAEKELLLAWEKEGKQHFHVCHNCGRYVSDAMYNAEVWDNYVVTPGGDGETTVTEITVDRSVVDEIVTKNAEAIANEQSPAGLTVQLGKKTFVTYDAETLEAIQKAVEAKQQSSSAARADLLLRVKGYGDTESLVEEEELTEAQEETVGEYVSNNCWTVVLTADYYDYPTSGDTWVLVDTAEVDFDGGDEDAVEVTVECDLEKFDYRSERFGVARVEEDGSLTPVESETNEKDGTITWHTRHFSLYMAYEKGAGVKVTGQVKGYHSGNAPVVQLYAAGDTERETPIATAALGEAAASGGQYLWNFAFDAVASGTYDLVVTKAGHLTYTVKGVTVGDTDLDLTASSSAAVKLLSLLAGDMNGDGSIDVSDLNIVWNATNFNKGVGDCSPNWP